MVTIEVEADAEGYRYQLSCVAKGQQISRAEHTEDLEHTINAKYLLAINEALSRMRIKTEIKIKLHRTGRHIYTSISNGWPDKWEQKGWENARKEPVKNKELWQQYRNLTKGQMITVELQRDGDY